VSERVAFVGLGVMGYPMAERLRWAGHEVTVFNRTTAKAWAWVEEHGGSVAATPAEADLVFTCVADDPDARAVMRPGDWFGVFSPSRQERQGRSSGLCAL